MASVRPNPLAGVEAGSHRYVHTSTDTWRSSAREEKEEQLAEPRNFDELYNGNRAFVLGGQEFHWRPLHWREWGELVDVRVARETEEQQKREKFIADLISGGKTLEQAEQAADDEVTLVSTFEDLVERVLVYVEPGEKDRLSEVINNPEKRVSVAILNDLVVWLQEVQTPDRPTETPMSSSSGPGTSGATSPGA